jgi:hypothetical protein
MIKKTDPADTRVSFWNLNPLRLRLVLVLLCPLAQWCCVLLLVGRLLVGVCLRCVLCVCPEGVY